MKQVLPIYKKKNYSGERIGEWLVTSEAYYEPTKTGGRYLWKCICSCGTEKLVGTTSLLYGKTLMCISCANNEKNSSKENNPNWKGHGRIPGTVLQKIKWNAKRRSRDLEVNIDAEYLNDLWEKQDGKCYFSGRQLVISETASVDRTDSNLGYIKGNVQWVHKDVNKAKMELSSSDFITLCQEIAAHQIK